MGYKWLVDVFDKYTKNRVVGKYRLLLLDGHKSHFTPEFDQYCKDNSIICLCYPPHSTDRLQPLDVGCFSPLKNIYGRLVQEKAELGIYHIDKPDFLVLFQQARIIALTPKNIKSAFQAVGILPFDPQKVLSRLKVRTPSPRPQSPSETQVLVKTPYTTTDFQNHIQVIQQHRNQGCNSGFSQGHILDPRFTLGSQLNPTDQALHYMAKGYNMAQYEITLLKQEVGRLRDENQWKRKKKEARRSYVARGGLLQVEEGRQLASERTKLTANSTTQRLCGACKLPGHNQRTCPGIQDSIHVAS